MEKDRERKTDVAKNIREERQRGKTKRAESRLVRKTGGKKSKEKKDRCRHNGNGERQRRKDTSEAEEDRKERQKETKKITKNVKDRRRSSGGNFVFTLFCPSSGVHPLMCIFPLFSPPCLYLFCAISLLICLFCLLCSFMSFFPLSLYTPASFFSSAFLTSPIFHSSFSSSVFP